jgi:hypothetical protein
MAAKKGCPFEFSGRVGVGVRVRPPFQNEIDAGFTSVVHVVEGNDDEFPSQIVLSQGDSDQAREFNFDIGFNPDMQQKEVFATIGQPIVDCVMNGQNGTLFAYGQTGTGKTYTMGLLGRVQSVDSGIVPRSLVTLFDALNSSKEREWSVSLSFLQIYMETLIDLLNPEASQMLALRENPHKGFFVEGLQQIEIFSAEDGLDLINLGLENRVMAPTLMNATSSRSHTLLTLFLRQRKSSQTLHSKLTLVDLAGSERVRKTNSNGMRLDEAKSINASLSALGNVIAALTDPHNHHTPYRDSKLTRLLQDSLGGNSNTFLLATVGPSIESYQETLSTLLFAQRCMHVKTYAVVNAQINYKVQYKQLQRELEQVKAENAQREMLLTQRYEAMIRELSNSSSRPPSGLDFSSASSDYLSGSSDQMRKAAEGAWKLVYLLFETFQEVHESIHNLRISSGAPEPPEPPLLRRSPADFKSVQDFVRSVQELRLRIIGRCQHLSSMCEIRDGQLSAAKDELEYHESEKVERERELANWSKLLKYLLTTNATLRKHVSGVGRNSASPRIGPGPALDIVRTVNGIVMFQRLFRRRRQSRMFRHSSGKMHGSAARSLLTGAHVTTLMSNSSTGSGSISYPAASLSSPMPIAPTPKRRPAGSEFFGSTLHALDASSFSTR